MVPLRRPRSLPLSSFSSQPLKPTSARPIPIFCGPTETASSAFLRLFPVSTMREICLNPRYSGTPDSSVQIAFQVFLTPLAITALG